MVVHGRAMGKHIELDEPLPFVEGQRISMRIEAFEEYAAGSPGRVAEAMRSTPHLSADDVDAFDSAIAEAKLPIRDASPFDEG